MPEVPRYKSYVGPPEFYDVAAAMQFSLLIFLGLREYHSLLDIGCGSLRGGEAFYSLFAAKLILWDRARTMAY